MTLVPGDRLGAYEILSPLGAGGMGEVYRARDIRLSREVAIKILPERLASNPERLKRFEKEACSASALNHPSIVTIYDVGQTGGVSIGHRRSAKWRELPSIVPVEGGEPREIPGWSGGWPVQWTADGRALYVYRARERQVWLVDVETGKARLWKQLPRLTGWGGKFGWFRVTPGGTAYVYTTRRGFSELYLVEGLR
jgi:hypothetical protein